MLKWRYTTEDNDRQVKLLRVRRAGIDLQRRSIAKAVCLQKFKELKETMDFQAKFIDRLMLDKDNSLRLLDSVMLEFSALGKQINMAEEENVFEKAMNRKLRTEMRHWRAECANLRLCAKLLQAEVDRVKPIARSRSTRDQQHDQTGPLETTEIVQGSSTQERRLSLDETFQNLENESRLEVQGSSNLNPGLNETTFSPSDMFAASDFKHCKSQRTKKHVSIPSSTRSSSTHQQRSPRSPKTVGCFRRFRIRKKKVYMLGFSALGKQINMAEEENVFEKAMNRKLRTEMRHWRAECANLRLCAKLLQAEVDRVKPIARSRSTRDQQHDQTGPLETTEIVQGSSTQERRLSLDETFQNLENESRLEVQGSSNLNPGLNETTFSPSDMFAASDFKHCKSQRTKKHVSIPSSTRSSSTHQQRSPRSPKTVGCFRRFRIRKKKVYSLPEPTIPHSHHVGLN